MVQVVKLVVIFIGLLLFAAVVISPPDHIQPPIKMALVIGNQDYLEPSLRLDNPVNDATAIHARLTELDFQTQLVINASKAEMQQALSQFIVQAREAKRQGQELVLLLYYAGHGIQFERVNYLVPIDSQLANMPLVDEAKLRGDLYSLKQATDHIATLQANLNIVVLDACRDLPISELNNAIGGWADVVQKDFFVAFGTAPGAKAFDGTGRPHGIYTEALLTQLDEPGLALAPLFQRVRKQVMADSDGGQIPQESNQARVDLVLNQKRWWQQTYVWLLLSGLGVVLVLMGLSFTYYARLVATKVNVKYGVKDLKLNKLVGQVSHQTCSLGRAKGNLLCVEDPDCYVSRIHCHLKQVVGRGEFIIQEAASANGTYMERSGKMVRLKSGKAYRLRLGQVFYLVADKSQLQSRPFSLVTLEQES